MKTLRLFNLNDWAKVAKGVELIDPKRRKVRFMLNVDGVASVYWKQGRKKTFLGLADGLTCIEFETVGTGTIITEGAEAWWRCTEVQHRQVAEANESFAQPHDPRARNPELELMMAKMQHNSDLRLLEMEKMHEKRFREHERALREQAASIAESAGNSGQQAEAVPENPAGSGDIPEPVAEQTS